MAAERVAGEQEAAVLVAAVEVMVAHLKLVVRDSGCTAAARAAGALAVWLAAMADLAARLEAAVRSHLTVLAAAAVGSSEASEEAKAEDILPESTARHRSHQRLGV